ncbi:hypothetical protein EXIGLDRAFT_770451 [Exidia glandulosa HHB12029]|uniref:Uncharacterized protein n=1 Tax=Exidia glandulosa HHB12029 TaxID=1314781 RepID=A0A165GNP2_EXIGL|nr:hypothetical protein EXIGLDRAFT_770451 [Exidia glandulosa HHB12029]
MSATRPSRLRRTLLGDLEHIEQVQRDVDNAAQAHASAAAALRLAQAEYDATKLELEIQRDRLQGFIRSADSVRSSLQTLATFPADLLSIIFVHAATEREDDTPWYQVTDDADALRLPYRVSAVCRHWREVARSTAQLWACIRIPSTAPVAPSTGPNAIADRRLLDHVTFHLALSRAAALNIVWNLTLARSSSQDLPRCAAERDYEDAFYSQLFDLVIQNSPRIRSFVLNTTPAVAWGSAPIRLAVHTTKFARHIVAFLRCRTPKLVEIAVWCQHRSDVREPGFWQGFPNKEFPLLLPDAPNLRRLHIVDAPIGLWQGHPGLPGLTDVHIKLVYFRLFDVLLWSTLAATPSLDVLSLCCELDNEHNFEANPPSSLPISRLSLAQDLDSESDLAPQVLESVSLPNLSSLAVQPHMVSSLIINDTLARKLSSLDISGPAPLDAEDFAILRLFEVLEVVCFRLEQMKMDDHTLFQLLCDPADPMWPRLRHLTIYEVASDSVERDGILHLVRSRNLASPETRIARPLELVEFDLGSVPRHVAIQVEEIMGVRCRLLE